MAKTIQVAFRGKQSTFELTKVERKTLYGCKRRIGVDAKGRECASALLTRDGRHLLPAGSTAELYLDEAGDVVERKDLVACDAEGKPLPEMPATTREAQELTGPIPLETILNYLISDVYQVDCASLDAGLRSSLEQGDIYRFSFRLRDTYSDHPAFLLMNDDGVFVLSGRETRFEFVGLAQPAVETGPWNDNEEENFALDFDMV